MTVVIEGGGRSVEKRERNHLLRAVSVDIPMSKCNYESSRGSTPSHGGEVNEENFRGSAAALRKGLDVGTRQNDFRVPSTNLIFLKNGSKPARFTPTWQGRVAENHRELAAGDDDSRHLPGQ